MEHLTELRDRVAMLPSLENRKASLQKKVQQSKDEVSGLLRQYEREIRDVEQIQKESLSSFVFRVLGKYEEKLEKEQREEIQAKLAYDLAVTRFDALTQEKEELTARIVTLRDEARIYKLELENRRREMTSRLTEQDGARYAELESERQSIISQITEIKEAISAAARTKSMAQRALDSLEKAKGWATFDVFASGGIISHVAKYSHIDSAERSYHTLDCQLRNLKSELGDIHGLTVSGLGEVSSTQRAVDFWLDNIFTDLSVRGRIKDNAKELSRLLHGIAEVESGLNAKLRTEEAKLVENRKREEELLIAYVR